MLFNFTIYYILKVKNLITNRLLRKYISTLNIDNKTAKEDINNFIDI